MKSFVQYGAGNIGRGFIGALFSLSGYSVEFIDVNMEIINALNQRKSYPVEIVSKAQNREITIQNVSGVDGRSETSVAHAIADAELMATAVGVNILPYIVPNIVAGLRMRWNNGNKKPLNIIICENLIDADKLLHKLIFEKLSDDEKTIFDERVGLVEASIGRMVPVMTEDMKKGDCLRVCVEKYSFLPIDKAAFKGEIPDIPNLRPFTPFEYYIRRKLFVHNMGHALTAYTGRLCNYEYIWQAIGNPSIKLLAQRAMEESARALSKHYNVPLDGLLDHIDDLLIRFGNSALGDTVSRVGKDTRRKLSSSDRLAGAALFCEQNGIEPVYICAGIAAGLLFENANDDGTAFINGQVKNNGAEAVLKDICGLGGTKAIEYVNAFYSLLKSGGNTAALLEKCEAVHENILNGKNIA